MKFKIVSNLYPWPDNKQYSGQKKAKRRKKNSSFCLMNIFQTGLNFSLALMSPQIQGLRTKYRIHLRQYI